MESIDEFIVRLQARLPELEWKLSFLGDRINPKQLPRGLFREHLELAPQLCIDEIRTNLKNLKQQPNLRAAHYLAERVNQKINVLVKLCQIHHKTSGIRQENFGLRAISTRQQWLQSLREDVDKLSAQQVAITTSINNNSTNSNSAVMLSLRAELGLVQQRLTLAKETLDRAMLW